MAGARYRRSSARSQVTRSLLQVRPHSGKEAVRMERIIRRIHSVGERVFCFPVFYVLHRVCVRALRPIRYLAATTRARMRDCTVGAAVISPAATEHAVII